MRNLKINESLVKFKNLTKQFKEDIYGNEVETYEEEFHECKLCLSQVGAKVMEDIFGRDIKYSLSASTHDMNCKINTNSIIYFNNKQYEVKKVILSYSVIRYALDEVKTDEKN